MKDSLKRKAKPVVPAKAEQPRISALEFQGRGFDPSQPAMKAQPWWAADAVQTPVAAPEPAADTKPAPAASTKANPATVKAELSRIASKKKQ